MKVSSHGVWTVCRHGWITDEAASLCERKSPTSRAGVEAGHGDGVEVCPEDT